MFVLFNFCKCYYVHGTHLTQDSFSSIFLLISIPVCRNISSKETITPFFSPNSHLCKSSMSTAIIRRLENSTSGQFWNCYFYEINESDAVAGRDIFVRYRHQESGGGWSTHFYRPFHPDSKSLSNLKQLVSDKKIACWEYYYESCSSPVMAINFRSPDHPLSVAGCFVKTIIPARNNDHPMFNATYSLMHRTPPDSRCNVVDCRICRIPGPAIFKDGEYVETVASPYKFVSASEKDSKMPDFLPILERAYDGNIVVLNKSKHDEICLAVPFAIFSDYRNSSVAVKFNDFSILFYPIPRQNCGHPLSTFLESAIRDNWIQINDEPYVFFKREPLPPSLLHIARNLIILQFESRNDNSIARH